MPHASVHLRELFNMIIKEENIHDLKMNFLSSVKKISSCVMCGISRGKNNHFSYKSLNIFSSYGTRVFTLQIWKLGIVS